jgi:hypothetical protein
MDASRNFFPFVLHFSPGGAKNEGQKKKSTMLPQAKNIFCINLRD